MARKVNPKIYRINMHERYLSNWFTTDKKEYSKNLHEDIKIREIVYATVSSSGIDRVVISRSSGNISVDIYVARPGLAIGKGGSGIELLEKKISKAIGQKVSIMVHEVKQPFLSASIVANSVAEALQKRVPPKVVMKQQIDRMDAAGAKGARIEVAGIGPVKQARTERVELVGGKIPLTTIRAKIDYGYTYVLIDKIYGIKVWIYKGEV